MRLNHVLSSPIVRLGRRVSPEYGRGFLLPFARRTVAFTSVEPEVLRVYLAALRTGSLGERVGEIAQPTLVLSGMRDPLVSPRQAYALAERIPHAHLHLLPGAQHVPMEERPRAFTSALEDFLRDHPIADDSSGARGDSPDGGPS